MLLPEARLSDAGTYRVLVSNPDGTILSSAARLTITGPRLHIAFEGNRWRVSWPPNSTLQRATNVAGPYVDVPEANSPFAVEFNQPQEYFRLRR
jgi:hypothetical protein